MIKGGRAEMTVSIILKVIGYVAAIAGFGLWILAIVLIRNAEYTIVEAVDKHIKAINKMAEVGGFKYKPQCEKYSDLGKFLGGFSGAMLGIIAGIAAFGLTNSIVFGIFISGIVFFRAARKLSEKAKSIYRQAQLTEEDMRRVINMHG